MLLNPSLPIAVAVQGDSITGLGKACAEMDKKGAWGRFLYDVSPNRTMRTRYTPQIPEEIQAAHDGRIKALMEVCYDSDDVLEMTLSEEAADVFFDEYYVPGDPNLKADHYRVRIKGWDEKQPGRVIRIAGLRTLYEDPHAKEISASVLRDVIALDETMIAHAHRASGYMTLTASDPLAPARDVRDWIEGKMPTGPIKASEVQAVMRKQRRPWCVRLEDVLEALTVLEEYGHIKFMSRQDGGQEKRMFLVHPKYLGEPEEAVETEVPAPEEGSQEPAAQHVQGFPAQPDAEAVEKAETEEERLLREAALRLSAFAAEFCDTGVFDTHWVSTQELLDGFASYVSDTGWLTLRRMGQIVKRVFPDTERGKKRIDGKQVPVYKGVRIIPLS